MEERRRARGVCECEAAESGGRRQVVVVAWSRGVVECRRAQVRPRALRSVGRARIEKLNNNEQMRERIPPSTGFQQWSSKGDCPSTMVQDRVEMNASTMETRDREDFEERERERDFKPQATL